MTFFWTTSTPELLETIRRNEPTWTVQSGPPDDEPTPDVTDTVNPESVDKAPDIEAGPEDDPGEPQEAPTEEQP